MKKAVLLFISLIVLTTNTHAEEVTMPKEDKKEVTLVNCLSSTNSWYEVDGKVKRIRLLAYDPEDGSLSSEIDEYACSLLKNAKKIEVEYDLRALEKDKYNRELAWVYVDGKLLQDILIQKGYGQVNYVTSDYKYLSDLCASEKNAIIDKLGIWNYPNIKEQYCKSGIDINNALQEQQKADEEEESFNVRTLHYLLFINSGIVLLCLLLIRLKRG
ncbi:MAG: thermonuclease family protein [Bacilli bacterium]|nr:thermonuclease family protein [Bacilli bacterium]MDE6142331.1 thermonuclease family protein [Bacilli bacterium]